MGPYSSGDKNIKISYNIQEKHKELDSKGLSLSPMQDLYWSIGFRNKHLLFCQIPPPEKLCETCHTGYFMYVPILLFKYTVKIHKHV